VRADRSLIGGYREPATPEVVTAFGVAGPPVAGVGAQAALDARHMVCSRVMAASAESTNSAQSVSPVAWAARTRIEASSSFAIA
jgi:hypothetical protein